MKVNFVLLLLMYLIMNGLISRSFAQDKKYDIAKSSFFSETVNSSTPGNVFITQPEKLDLLIKKHIESNIEKKGIHGWRIQIFFSREKNAKSQANSLSEKFKTAFPEMRSYVKYNSPYFYVKVGDFREKSKALKFLKEFPPEISSTCWLVEDLIDTSPVEIIEENIDTEDNN